MKVAIMGAGLSGLACAITLERHGIKPVIFEKRGQVGDRFINGEALMSILYRPINDPIRYLSEEFQIYLKPTSHISKLNLYSENEHAVLNEYLGYVNIRGRHQQSFENQLKEQLYTNIKYHSEQSYEELTNNYTHVVLATGDAADAQQLGNFNVERKVTLMGVTVEGKFNRSEISVWLDHSFAPNGYGYLLPYSNTEANFALAFPDLPKGSSVDEQTLWDRAFETMKRQYNQELPIKDSFHIKSYEIGRCKMPRIGNTFFVGNNFGSINPFLGFGQFEALLTGIYAAYDLCGLGNYDQLTKQLVKGHQDSLILREAMEKLDNAKFDWFVKQLNRPFAEKLFTPQRTNTLKLISRLIKPFIKNSKS